IAIPLSLGIAAASGAPLIAGLVAAVVGGVVAGALGGSALQVSGPAAGLTVVVAGLVSQFGWAATAGITCAAGLLQILLRVTLVGRLALPLPPAPPPAMLPPPPLPLALPPAPLPPGGHAPPPLLPPLPHPPPPPLPPHP